MTCPAPRPVVALDIDGVLNRDISPSRAGAGWVRRKVTVRADGNFTPFSLLGEHDLDIPLVINPRLHGPWITRLREHADVVWASTWDRQANIHLSSLLGIDPLPVGISVSAQKPRRHDGPIDWKSRALQQAIPGRPVLWIDDGADLADPEVWRNPADTRRTSITTAPSIGMTREHMNGVEAWVDEHRSLLRPLSDDLLDLLAEGMEDGSGAPGLLSLVEGGDAADRTMVLSLAYELLRSAGWTVLHADQSRGFLDGLELAVGGELHRYGTGPGSHASFRESGAMLLRELAEQGRGLAIIVDRLERADGPGIAELCTTVQHWIREGLPICLLIAGHGAALRRLVTTDPITFIRRAERIRVRP